MKELKASLCYGNDSPGLMSPTPKPFEAVYPPTDLSEVVASLRRELSSMDKLTEEQAQEIAALRERLKSHQRAVLWCLEWINRAFARGLSPVDFATSIEDDRWNEVGALVGEAADEVDP